MDEEDAVYTLKQAKKVLDEEGVKFWLDTGTLLGAVRDGKIIPWDDDIDLGVWHSEAESLEKALKKLPDKIYFRISEKGAGVYYKSGIVSITKYRVEGDHAIRFFHIEKNQIAGFLEGLTKLLENEKNASSVSENIPLPITKLVGKILSRLPSGVKIKLMLNFGDLQENFSSKDRILVSVPKEYFKDLSRIEFYDMEFNVPSPVEDYLEYRYGEDWKTPQKDYVYYEEDGGIGRKNDA